MGSTIHFPPFHAAKFVEFMKRKFLCLDVVRKARLESRFGRLPFPVSFHKGYYIKLPYVQKHFLENKNVCQKNFHKKQFFFFLLLLRPLE